MREIPEEIRERMKRLVDPKLMLESASYAYSIRMMQTWLEVTHMAMEDEHVPSVTINRVLNRLVVGTPSGASDLIVEAQQKEMLKMIMNAPAPSVLADLGVPHPRR